MLTSAKALAIVERQTAEEFNALIGEMLNRIGAGLDELIRHEQSPQAVVVFQSISEGLEIARNVIK